MPDYIYLPEGAKKLPKKVAEQLEAARGKHKDGLPEKKVIVRQDEIEVKTEWSTEKLGGDAWSAAIRTLRERGVVED
jgi:hypothetical protein